MISLRDVRFGYSKGTTAFACDTLDVGPGVSLLLGPNGAGTVSYTHLTLPTILRV